MESSKSSRRTSESPHFRNSYHTTTPSKRIRAAIKGKSCAICLSQIAGHHRAAVIAACFHAYCLRCLLRWSNYKRTCPLCNSPFDSYFTSSHPSSRFFHTHRLLPLRPPPPNGRRETDATPLAVQRVLRRTREEINAANRRSRPVPRQRSFRRLESLSCEEIAERVLQWRASIYRLGLRPVPFESRNRPNLNMTLSSGHKDQILRRIEPWIRRELQAILLDPDPTIIVHVATALYLSSIEKSRVSSRCHDSEDTLLAPLHSFLHEWTTAFWHELRCFAESPYTMETYDEVVEYRKSD